MPNENRIVIKGHIGQDPTNRRTANGVAVVSFSVATNYGKGEKQQTEWVKCTAFGDLAEIIMNEFSKGSAIHVEGPIRTRSWEDVHGDKKYTTEVICNYLAKPLYKRRDASTSPPKQQTTQQQPVTEDLEIPF